MNAGTRRGWLAAGGGRCQYPDQQREERRPERTTSWEEGAPSGGGTASGVGSAIGPGGGERHREGAA